MQISLLSPNLKAIKTWDISYLAKISGKITV